MLAPLVLSLLALAAAAILALKLYRDRYAATAVAAGELALARYVQLLDANYNAITVQSLSKALKTCDKEQHRLLLHLQSNIKRIGQPVDRYEQIASLLQRGMLPPPWVEVSVYGITQDDLRRYQHKHLPKPT